LVSFGPNPGVTLAPRLSDASSETINSVEQEAGLVGEYNFERATRAVSVDEAGRPEVLQTSSRDRLAELQVVRQLAFARWLSDQCAQHQRQIPLPERLKDQLRLALHLPYLYAMKKFMAFNHFADQACGVIVRERERT
jgi:hypothetical protein